MLASAAIPAVFPPAKLGGRALVDGALASNTPLAAALKLGAERLIVLHTGYSCARSAPPASALAMALHALNLLIARQLVVDVERFSSLAEILVVPPLCPLAISAASFARSEELIFRAAAGTRRSRASRQELSEWVPAAIFVATPAADPFGFVRWVRGQNRLAFVPVVLFASAVQGMSPKAALHAGAHDVLAVRRTPQLGLPGRVRSST